MKVDTSTLAKAPSSGEGAHISEARRIRALADNCQNNSHSGRLSLADAAQVAVELRRRGNYVSWI